MATWQHLRSSTAHKRPTTSLADGRIAINTNTASPGLFFKDSAGTGIVKVGPVHVGTTAPNSTPAAGGSSGNYLGEQWLDTSLTPAQLKVWNGSAWVGVVADELPVAKLQDGAAGQIIQTDAAGTGVEWSNTTNLPLGTATAPAYRFQGDSNTGVYSPGADQLALSTNGAGRLFVGSTGNVGVNTSSPLRNLHVTGTSSAVVQLSTSSIACYQAFQNSNSTATNAVQIGAVGTDDFAVHTGNTGEKLRIINNGNVGIGTTSPVALLNISSGDTAFSPAAEADELFLESSGHCGLTIGCGANQKGNIYFGESATGVSRGAIVYDTNTDSLNFSTAGLPNERARIDSSGRLLVGTSSDSGGALLQVNGNRIRVATAKTPASASDTGTTGEICWDASYIYVCTATNTWKRAALSTW